jgi:hypothetical protein
MAKHRGDRDYSESTGYEPKHASQSTWGKSDWDNYQNSTESTTVIPKVDPKQK